MKPIFDSALNACPKASFLKCHSKIVDSCDGTEASSPTICAEEWLVVTIVSSNWKAIRGL
jgi:hypothetical protein|eukprot:scaffold815_cov273-Chaetoceros_neogracile.AAC.10